MDLGVDVVSDLIPIRLVCLLSPFEGSLDCGVGINGL